MNKRQGSWSREEMLRVLVAYAGLPFDTRDKVNKNYLLGLQNKIPKRTVGSLQMRINNYIARDPEMQILGKKGMHGGGGHVDEIWAEFSNSEKHLDHQKLLAQAAIEL